MHSFRSKKREESLIVGAVEDIEDTDSGQLSCSANPKATESGKMSSASKQNNRSNNATTGTEGLEQQETKNGGERSSSSSSSRQLLFPRAARRDKKRPSTSSRSSQSAQMTSAKYICADVSNLRTLTTRFLYPKDPTLGIVRRCPKVTLQIGEDIYIPLDRYDDFGSPGKNTLFFEQKKGSRSKSPQGHPRSSSPSQRKPPSSYRKKVRRVPRYAYELDDEDFRNSGIPVPLCFARPSTKQIYREQPGHVVDLFEMLHTYQRPIKDEDEESFLFGETSTPLSGQGHNSRAMSRSGWGHTSRTLSRSRSNFSVRFASDSERRNGSKTSSSETTPSPVLPRMPSRDINKTI